MGRGMGMIRPILTVFAAMVLSLVLTAPLEASEELLAKAAKESAAKNHLKARELYREAYIAARSGPLADRGLFGLAKTEYLLKNYSEAALHLRRYAAIQGVAQRDEALLMLGYANYFQNRPAEADRIFATIGGEELGRALIGRAEIALQNQQTGSAESLFSKVDKKLAESDSRAIYVQAMLLARKGYGDQAVAMIDRLSPLVLRNEDLRVERAVVYLLSGRTKEAVVLLNSFIQTPTSGMEQVRARRALFQAYEQQGKTDELLKIGIELLQFEGNDELRRKMVMLYEKQGDLENALRQASQLRDRGIRSLEVEKRLKKVLEADTPQSVDLIQRFAFYLHAESPVLAECAVYLTKKGKKSEARALLQKAAKGTGASDASLALAEIYLQDGLYDEASRLLQPLAATKQHGQAAQVLLADLADRKGDSRGAIALLQKSLKQGKPGKQSRIEVKLGDLYWRAGERAPAVRHYDAAADAGDTEAMVKAADAHYLSGHFGKAEKYYKKALDKDLKDARQKQWVQYQYGKLTSKRDYLEKAAASGGEIGEAAQIHLNRR